MTHAWHQLNVALARGPGGEGAPLAARAVFAALEARLASDRHSGALRAFFFMRKAPDMRLRFELEPRGIPAYARALEPLRRAGLVRAIFASVYEPEARLFGGPEAMAHVHAHFDADARLFLELDRLSERGQANLPWDVLARAVVDDLFERTLDGDTEVWDAWCNVADAAGVDLRAPLEASAAYPRLADLETHTALEAERAVVRGYRAANAALAEGLRAEWSAGHLLTGLRGALPFVALFHFNRFGLDATLRGEIARAQVASRDPRRRMKGTSS